MDPHFFFSFNLEGREFLSYLGQAKTKTEILNSILVPMWLAGT